MHTTTQKLEYSYKDGDGYHFMDLDTYEDSILSESMIGDDECFLVEGNSYDILLVDGDPVRLELPASVEAKVVEAPDAIRGDTAGNAQASDHIQWHHRASALVHQEGRCHQNQHCRPILS